MGYKIKISQSNIIELAQPNHANYNLDLLGTEKLVDYNETLKFAIKKKEIDLAVSHFKDNYTENDCFFYIVRKYSKQTNQPLLTEVGIGTLISQSTELRRVRPLYFIDNVTNHTAPVLNGPIDLLGDNDDHYLIVGNYIPTNMAELLIQPNSVIVSSAKEYIPIAVELTPNSVLGRLDNEIECITLDDISSHTLQKITQYTKQLILKTSQLDVKKVKTKQLVLEPHNAPDAKRGTLYYKADEDLLLYYTGEKWRSIVWQEYE